MKAILLFQAKTGPSMWPPGLHYQAMLCRDCQDTAHLQYFRAVIIECGSLSDALDRLEHHVTPCDNFVNALPVYPES